MEEGSIWEVRLCRQSPLTTTFLSHEKPHPLYIEPGDFHLKKIHMPELTTTFLDQAWLHPLNGFCPTLTPPTKSYRTTSYTLPRVDHTHITQHPLISATEYLNLEEAGICLDLNLSTSSIWH
jgi:hypothetical protein